MECVGRIGRRLSPDGATRKSPAHDTDIRVVGNAVPDRRKSAAEFRVLDRGHDLQARIGRLGSFENPLQRSPTFK